MELSELPQELLAHILSYLAPSDIILFGQSSQQTWSFIAPDNKLLWQSAFLHVFDDPHEAWSHLNSTARKLNQSIEDSWDWHARLKQRLSALRAVGHIWTAAHADVEDQEDNVAAILDMLETAKPAPSQADIKGAKELEVDDRSSLNVQLLPMPHDVSYAFDKMLRGPSYDPFQQRASWDTSPLWHAPGRPTTRSMANGPNARSEAAYKLHVLGGVTGQESKDRRALGQARQLLYSWDNTNESNDYGPFHSSGEVDWRRLESVCSVVTRHFSRAVQGRMTLPQGFPYSIPFRTLRDPSQPLDWARATGPWCGTYVFLNWEDLFEFNTMGHTRLRPSLEDGPESCGGLMKLNLKLNEDLKEDPKLQSNLPICNDLPPLFFSGASSSYDSLIVTGVRGMACLTPNGKEVRWRFIVHYSGEDQWQLEGVQPGGVRSGCIYGLWTSCSHEDGGPVGPFIYAPEELCKTTAIVLRS